MGASLALIKPQGKAGPTGKIGVDWQLAVQLNKNATTSSKSIKSANLKGGCNIPTIRS
jgi:hypothetical protein